MIISVPSSPIPGFQPSVATWTALLSARRDGAKAFLEARGVGISAVKRGDQCRNVGKNMEKRGRNMGKTWENMEQHGKNMEKHWFCIWKSWENRKFQLWNGRIHCGVARTSPKSASWTNKTLVFILWENDHIIMMVLEMINWNEPYC